MQSSSASHSPTPVPVRQENASLGSSRGDARRSSRSIATNETIAVTIRPSFSKDDPAAEVADVAAMARQISATRPSGTRADDARCAAVTGDSTKKAAIASTTAVAALATKAPRQLAKCANIPPTSGPISTDMLQLVDISAIVRDHMRSGNVPRTST